MKQPTETKQLSAIEISSVTDLPLLSPIRAQGVDALAQDVAVKHCGDPLVAAAVAMQLQSPRQRLILPISPKAKQTFFESGPIGDALVLTQGRRIHVPDFCGFHIETRSEWAAGRYRPDRHSQQ